LRGKTVAKSKLEIQVDKLKKEKDELLVQKDKLANQLSESKLKQEELVSIINKSSNAIYILNKGTGEILYSNDTALKRTGYSREELLIKNINDICINEEYDMQGFSYNHLQNKRLIHVGVNDERPVKVKSDFVFWNDQKAIYLEVVDISELVSLENNVEMYEKAQEFLRHELKSMAHIFKSYSKLALKIGKNLSKRVKKYLEFINYEGNLLENLERSSAQIAALEKGEAQFDKKKYSLNQLVQSSIDELKSLSEQKIKVQYNRPKENLESFFDYTFVNRAVTNIIKNAIEHDTDVKKDDVVTVSLFKEGDYAVIKVNNKGKSLLEEQLKTFFNKYNTTKSKGKGSGLGTTYSSLVVLQHDGEIDVDSNQTDGTTVTIKLPLIYF
jgi:PAS domain S-box-containing protein